MRLDALRGGDIIWLHGNQTAGCGPAMRGRMESLSWRDMVWWSLRSRWGGGAVWAGWRWYARAPRHIPFWARKDRATANQQVQGDHRALRVQRRIVPSRGRGQLHQLVASAAQEAAGRRRLVQSADRGVDISNLRSLAACCPPLMSTTATRSRGDVFQLAAAPARPWQRTRALALALLRATTSRAADRFLDLGGEEGGRALIVER